MNPSDSIITPKKENNEDRTLNATGVKVTRAARTPSQIKGVHIEEFTTTSINDVNEPVTFKDNQPTDLKLKPLETSSLASIASSKIENPLYNQSMASTSKAVENISPDHAEISSDQAAQIIFDKRQLYAELCNFEEISSDGIVTTDKCDNYTNNPETSPCRASSVSQVQ